MCGIVGVVGRAEAAPLLLDALKRLEYRGYDSAGIATLDGAGRLERRRAAGKLRNLEAVLEKRPLPGTIGIGHTRWATHGAPTEGNAHPHHAGRVAIVHNGIIENYRHLRDALRAEGVAFESETDTEVIAHLVDRALAEGASLERAMRDTLAQLTGAYALAVMVESDREHLAVARRGSPLAIGFGEGAVFVGSDAIALAPYADALIYLEEGDWGIVGPDEVRLFDREGNPAERGRVATPAQISLADRGNYRHFMAKEIHEQPTVIGQTLGHYVDLGALTIRREIAGGIDFARLGRLSLTACGTAFYAGLVGRYWFERLARLPIDLDVASEFRYRHLPFDGPGLSMVISQSGETADTLASLRACRAAHQTIASVVNVATSTIARESDVVFPTLAGPEIGVASTKAFTCQLAVLAALAVLAGRARGTLTAEDERAFVTALAELPRFVADILLLEPAVERIARLIAPASHALYLGRGTAYPIALEGALKLKEISYIHAEGYAAGELKHGPIALVDETMPVVVIAPFDDLFEKTASNMQEVAARGGKIVLVTDPRGAEAADGSPADILVLPDAPSFLTPILYAVPLQLLAYHAAIINGTDVDQPRNLAKSVTVE